MLTHITRFIAIFAVFSHNLLCGSLYCCALTCSPHEDGISVSHESRLPVSACSCHPEKQNHASGHENPGSDHHGGDHHDNKTLGSDDSKHDCDHRHHFCQCLQAAPPNQGIGVRVILNPGLFSLPVAFLAMTTPSPDLNHRTPETTGNSSALGVRLHSLLEHWLI